MKRLIQFVKTSLLGGLLVLLPLMLFILLVDELLGLVVALATPIADLFPKGMFDNIETPVLIAVLLILMVSFFFGLAMRMVYLRRLGLWIERTLLERLPIYTAVKRLSQGLLGGEGEKVFRPAVMTSGAGEREIVYLVEEHTDGEATVLVPWAPASFAGPVKIVQRSRLEMLDANLGETSRALSHWGVGVGKLLGKSPMDTSTSR
ncbi:MAG: hypothetical protein JRE12_18780 [Deltaproteobacteria bacterium]|nr:hypothetical protein [Deltaproteobacteria bacterium]